jgi:hypothetical protein
MEKSTGSDPGRESEPPRGSGLPEEPRLEDDPVDEVIAASFPASDPPQWWAGRPD